MPDGVQDVPAPEEPTPHEVTLRRALGAHYGAIAHLGLSAGEVVPVALESVIGLGAEIEAYTAGLTDFDSLSAELASADPLGFVLQVAFSETEVLPAGVLVPADSAGALFGLDEARESHQAVVPARGLGGRITERLGQFLDLLSLTLFTDGLAGTEVTLAGMHRGRAGSFDFLQDLAENTAPARIDVVVRLESGVTAPVTLILPLSLMLRMAAPPPAASGPAPASLEGAGGPARPLDLLVVDSLRVSVELGGSSMTAEEILELGPGSVVELNQLAAEPLDILVNDRLIARGEVLVVDEKFGVRITEISSPRQRAHAIER